MEVELFCREMGNLGVDEKKFTEMSVFVGDFFADKLYRSEEDLKKAIQEDFKIALGSSFPKYKSFMDSGEFFSTENLEKVLIGSSEAPP